MNILIDDSARETLCCGCKGLSQERRLDGERLALANGKVLYSQVPSTHRGGVVVGPEIVHLYLEVFFFL